MELTIINQCVEDKWLNYEDLLNTITNKTINILNIEDNIVLSCIFVTSKQIHNINKEYRNIDKPTDVISFALNDSEDNYELVNEDNEIGDIFINVEAIINQAKEYNHSIDRETCFLFTHGLLHLLGYDHMNEEDEKKMFKLQDDILDEIIKR